MRTIRNALVGFVALAVACPCIGHTAESSMTGLPSLADADAFVTEAEARLAQSRETLNRTLWVKQNFITFDTDLLAAKATEDYNNLIVGLLQQAKTFDGLDLPYDLQRKLALLKRQIDLP